MKQSKKKKSQDCLELIKLIPDYDPFDTDLDKYYFDPFNSDDDEDDGTVVDFFECYLTHAKGSLTGKPFILEDWEKAILLNLFGWKIIETGFRRYRECFVFVPRKNGKTALAAGVALYVLFCDGEKGAEIYSAAAERDQAALVFNQAKFMVENSPELAALAKIYTKAITLEQINSFYRTISADAKTKHGFNTHVAIIDELHAQPNRDLVDVLVTSTGARDQPLVIYITTSDFDRVSICNEKQDYATKVQQGLIKDDTFLPVLYMADKEDDWSDPETWRKANPNLGVSIHEDYLSKQASVASESMAYLNTFKRLHLNMRTETKTAWLNMDRWRGCKSEIRERQLRGLPCFAGLDLSNIQDVTALVLAFPIEEKFRLLCRFWIPKIGAEERDRHHSIPYLAWAEQGLITLTEGETIDYRFIRQEINDLSEVYDIREIAFDPWNATQFAKELQEVDGFNMIEMRQGTFTMNEPCKNFEKLVLSGDMDHGNNPVLDWMASNVSVQTDQSGNIRPVKAEGFAKIDGIVAAVMGVGRAMFTDWEKSVYEDRGLIEL